MDYNNPEINNTNHQEVSFEAFPAPRTWYLGWEGDEAAGIACCTGSTADYLPEKPENAKPRSIEIAMIIGRIADR